MKHLIVVLSLLTLFTVNSFAQEDVEGCKDYPMFSRMPHTYIQECTNNYNEVEVQLGAEETKTMEGTKTYIQYGYSEAESTAPSFFQIVKNYENAVAKFGGKKVFYSLNAGHATLSLRSNGKDFWVMLEDHSGGKAGEFTLTILEIEGMKQDIKADLILDELNKNGMIALYINFETGKSTIKEESHAIIDQMSKMLADNPSVKVSIEGHTDNVGKAAANKILSQERGESVMKALISSGINKDRMQSKGWGQEKPLADNGTEDGRAKNRRVEIVKIQ